MRLILPVFSSHICSAIKSSVFLIKYAFLSDSRCPCPRCIYCIPRPVCARSVRLPLSLNRGPGIPDLLNLSREIRGHVLSRREPVRRGLHFLKVQGGLKNLGLMSLVGGASSEASALYKTFSKPAADATESGGSAATNAAATSGH